MQTSSDRPSLKCFVSLMKTKITFLNRLPRTYQYCTPCAGHLGVWPVARPWVEVINNVQGPANMNRNLVTLPAPAQATFQRLGMQTGQQGIPSLEASHLEIKPLSPVDVMRTMIKKSKHQHQNPRSVLS